MKINWNVFGWGWTLLTLLLMALFILSNSAAEISLASMLLVLIVVATIAAVITLGLMWVYSLFFRRGNVSKALKKLQETYRFMAQGVLVNITNVSWEDVYPKRLYLVGKHKITIPPADQSKDENQFREFSFDDLPSAIVKMFERGEKNLVVDGHTYGTVKGSSRFGGLLLVQVDIMAADAAVFDIHPEEQTPSMRLRRRVRKDYGPDVQGIVVEVTDQPEDKRYYYTVYAFTSDLSAKLDAQEDVWASGDPSILSRTITDVLLGDVKNTAVVVAGTTNFLEMAKLLKVKVKAQHAEDFDLRYEDVPNSELLEKRLTAQYGSNLSGVLIVVTDQFEDKDYPDHVATWSDEADNLLEKADDPSENGDLDGLDQRIIDALLGESDDQIKIIGVEQRVPGVPLLKIELPAEYADDLDGLVYSDVDSAVVVQRRIQKEHGKDVQGVLITVVNAPLNEDYMRLLAFFDEHTIDREDVAVFADQDDVETFELCDEYSELGEALSGDRYEEYIHPAGVIEIVPGVKVLKVEIDAEDAEDPFYIQPTEVETAVVIERTLRNAYPNKPFDGFVIKITKQDPFERYLDQVYAFRGVPDLEPVMEAAQVSCDVMVIDDIDGDMASELCNDDGSDDYLTFGEIVDYHGVKLLEMFISAENASSYSMQYEEVSIDEVIKTHVQSKYGQDVVGVVVEIVHAQTGDVFKPTVYLFDDGSRALIERVSETYEEDTLDNMDDDVSDLVRGEKVGSNVRTAVKIADIRVFGQAKLLKVTIEAAEASSYGYYSN